MVLALAELLNMLPQNVLHVMVRMLAKSHTVSVIEGVDKDYQ